MRALAVFACCLLPPLAIAAQAATDCRIVSLRERVIAENAGPQPAVPQDEPVVTPQPVVYHVEIGCAQQRYFAILTSTNERLPDVFRSGAPVRIEIDGDDIEMQAADGTQARGRLTGTRHAPR